MRRIPISFIVKAQFHYVRVFEIEDSDFISIEESKERGQKQRALDDYVEKMFFDDEDTANYFYNWMNTGLIRYGTFKEICDVLRMRGYEVVSKDNATVKEIKECEKECLEKWKEWKNEHK